MHLFASNFCELKIIKHYVEIFLDFTYVNLKKLTMTKNMVLRSPAALPNFFLKIIARVNPKYLGCHEKGPVLEIH